MVSTFWAPSYPDPRLVTVVSSRLEKNAYEIAMPKNYNDTLHDGKSKSRKKRRKLFPTKSKSQKVSSLNNGEKIGINRESRLSAANYSCLHSGIYGDKKNRRFCSNRLSAESIPGRALTFSLPFTPSLLQEWHPLGVMMCT